ncbi:hypothetical protein MTO96_042074 [Rhipicephalus appendiculatus]
MLLKLPDGRTLTNYIGNTSGETGFSKLVESRLISEAESFDQPHSKVCSIIVDEIRVKEKLQYNKQRDCFVGQVDIGREELNGDLVLANSLLCFVISADSADCKLRQRERRLATIKASSATHLSHREAQAVLRAAPTIAGATGSSSPQASLAGGKTDAAVLGAAATEITNSAKNPLQVPLKQGGRQANAGKRGSAKRPSFQEEDLQSAINEENKNLRLLLRMAVDVLPPDSQQLRSICLQIGLVHLPSSENG